MQIARRALTFVEGFLASYAPAFVKKRLWDRDFAGGKWDFIDDTAGDCVYAHLQEHAKGGDILDLGCGPGNTANELAFDAYRTYTGVDISEVALEKARKRTHENGRDGKNSFAASDFLGYEPARDFDVILFRESLYHVPYGQVPALLEKYSKHLKPSGVFVVRLYAGDMRTNQIKFRVKRKLDLIERKFDVVDSRQYDKPGKPTVIVFRPRRHN